MKKFVFVLSILFFVSVNCFAQEALKSVEEDYYDYLSLTGITERPTINYRTLSDSEWLFNEENTSHIWGNNKLNSQWMLYDSGKTSDNWFVSGFDQSLNLKVYGPELFNSFNTASPYGQNDGALWQGKGYNTSLTAGVRLEGYGFELTLKPQLVFSQNMAFDFIKPNEYYFVGDKDHSGDEFANKAQIYGYYGVRSVDAPQRFGDTVLFDFNFGDTEARFTWKTFTMGFGFQNIWLGPSQLNPLLHSNNAPNYPKFDIGIRKTQLTMPYFGWDLGQLEARGWWGCLSESNFFDNIDTNDKRLIAGLAVAWQAPFLDQLTIGMNRTMISYWNNITPYTLFNIFIPGLSSSGGTDYSDQRASITVDYLIKKVGFEVYFEWAKNDYSPDMMFYIRYPMHSQAWTLGFNQSINLPRGLEGKLSLEFTNMELSVDHDNIIPWIHTFYGHHRVLQGYTNQGQWLGAGIGTGGNSQYLGFTVYYDTGSVTLFGQRRNPDLDYTIYMDAKNINKKDENGKTIRTWNDVEESIRANLDFGITWTQFIKRNLRIDSKYVFNWEINPLNDVNNTPNRFNNHFELSVKYNF